MRQERASPFGCSTVRSHLNEGDGPRRRHRAQLEPLPGTVFLFRCTPNGSGFYPCQQ